MKFYYINLAVVAYTHTHIHILQIVNTCLVICSEAFLLIQPQRTHSPNSIQLLWHGARLTASRWRWQLH